ncbi:septum site-determining protein Ssd [Corynebacterium sp.]|uniref:septum site-determining protein Ssd n=1 Tax=Corynebacterium sp. TaxID=1720 RepID=UPI0026DD1793|nr:septum site-determining protein Ssd [Corynebacterium sp.]MDO5077772.1 hypothetical protein [Corynebacterium sp.]
MTQQPILVAVAHPVVHPEAMHVAAATGRPIIDTNDPRDIARHIERCAAVLVCATVSQSLPPTMRGRVFLVCPDPGPPDWKAAVQCHAEQAFVLPAQAPELLQALGRDDPAVVQGTAVGVFPAVGGAGASVLAAAIARVAASYVSTAVIDADPYSGGLDLVFGLEESPGVRWGDMNLADGDLAGNIFAALPATSDGIRVLSAARTNVAAVESDITPHLGTALTSIRNVAELTIVDCTPATVAELAPVLDLVVMVVPAQVRPAAAATACAARLKAQHTELATIVRHIQWSGLEADDIERLTGVPILAELATIARLPKALDMQGLPARLPRPLQRAATAVLEELR